MLYAGILVVLRPEAWEPGLDRLAAIPGVEVHHTEPASSRVVVVVEAADLPAQEAALNGIRAVTGVLVAEPVYHYDPDALRGGAVENEPGMGDAGPASSTEDP
jgi:nitrate reductase NapD